MVTVLENTREKLYITSIQTDNMLIHTYDGTNFAPICFSDSLVILASPFAPKIASFVVILLSPSMSPFNIIFLKARKWKKN